MYRERKCLKEKVWSPTPLPHSTCWGRILALHRLVSHLANVPALPGLIWKNVKHLCAPSRATPVRGRRSVPTEHFEAVYANNPDPWNYRTSAYEQAKYAATLAALPDQQFRRAFDIGCSIGVLTEKLAKRCDEILAVDVVESALVQAREACAHAPHVAFARMRIPNEWPNGRFDLIVMSEVLCYLEPSDIRSTAANCLRSMGSKATIVLVNFLSPNKHPCYADEAVMLFCAALKGRCELTVAHRENRYRLDVLRAVR